MIKQMSYAGFWKRFAAAIIDSIITLVGSFAIIFVFGVIMVKANDPAVWEATGNIIGLIYIWSYFAVSESSNTQGTLGKRALGIKVTDLYGNRISFGKASGRLFGKIVSMLIMSIGFLMIAFTREKQGLHDMMAGCLVLNK